MTAMFRLLALALLALFMPVSESLALTVVTELSPPASMLRDGRLTGLTVEVVREIQKRVGDQSPIEALPWARAYAMAASVPDVVLFSTTRTPEREPLFHWIGPVMRIKWALYARAGEMRPLTHLDEARKVKAIGVYKDDARQQYLSALGFTNLVPSDDPRANVWNLLVGRLDMLVTTDVGIRTVLEQSGAPASQVENVLTFKEVDLYICFSPGSDESAVTAWRKAFEAMREDGTLDAIHARFMAGEKAPR
jgi:polar amino acid transport system substrate-binding protein